MTVTLDIPDEFSAELAAQFTNVGRAALEALAATAYARDCLSVEQVRRMLGAASRWEAQEVLSRHGVWPGLTADEIMLDARTAAKFAVPRK
jgi:hypothetical protein